MPITHRIRAEHNLCVTRHRGSIDDASFIDSYATLFAQSEYKNVTRHIIDLRETDSRHRSSSVLKRFAENVGTQRSTRKMPHVKIAVIAPSDLSYGLSRLFEACAGIGDDFILITRSMSDAFRFLELPTTIEF